MPHKTLYKLYNTKSGRALLKILTAPFVSDAAGRFLDTRKSIALIPLFIKTSGLDMTEVKPSDWQSFNDFFTRRLIDGAREICTENDAFISPCDADLTVYPIEDGRVIPVKGVQYTVADLVRSKTLAAEYDGGLCMVFRLSTKHYHRYSYPETGRKSRYIDIKGVLHTVQPVATESTDVYVQNSRSYCKLFTESFGNLIFMQVGAMLVGRICNNDPGAAQVVRGGEAGRFEYGGSTVIVLSKAGRIRINDDIKKASAENKEYPVRLGMKIGTKG